jgi:hypothetical protein
VFRAGEQLVQGQRVPRGCAATGDSCVVAGGTAYCVRETRPCEGAKTAETCEGDRRVVCERVANGERSFRRAHACTGADNVCVAHGEKTACVGAPEPCNPATDRIDCSDPRRLSRVRAFDDGATYRKSNAYPWIRACSKGDR